MVERRGVSNIQRRRMEIDGKFQQDPEQKGERWSIVDSPLIAKRGNVSFEGSFKHVLPEGEKDLKGYIEETLSNRRGKAIGLELGGTASQLFADFTPEFFRQTAGISLTDYRDSINPDLKEADATRNHSVIEGNMLEDATKRKVENWLDGSTVDVIFERMKGGHSCLPNEPFYMAQQVNYWYQHLSEGGLLFAEMPWAFSRTLASSWEEHIQENYQGKLEVQSAIGIFVRLKKLEGAPAELPLLDARTVVRESRIE